MVDFKLKVGMVYDGKKHKAGEVIQISEHQAKIFHYAGEIVERKQEDGKKAERAINSKRAKRRAVSTEHSE